VKEARATKGGLRDSGDTSKLDTRSGCLRHESIFNGNWWLGGIKAELQVKAVLDASQGQDGCAGTTTSTVRSTIIDIVVLRVCTTECVCMDRSLHLFREFEAARG
jgi:hypothetical protein